MENHCFIDAVEKLWSEMVFQFIPYRIFHISRVLAEHALNDFGSDVRRHDNHSVFEIHCSALPVSQASVVEYL